MGLYNCFYSFLQIFHHHNHVINYLNKSTSINILDSEPQFRSTQVDFLEPAVSVPHQYYDLSKGGVFHVVVQTINSQF